MPREDLRIAPYNGDCSNNVDNMSATTTPPRKHIVDNYHGTCSPSSFQYVPYKSPGCNAPVSPTARKNSRWACTTSSTVLTAESHSTIHSSDRSTATLSSSSYSSSSGSSAVASDGNHHYYLDTSEDENDAVVPCWGGWFFKSCITSSARKNKFSERRRRNNHHDCEEYSTPPSSINNSCRGWNHPPSNDSWDTVAHLSPLSNDNCHHSTEHDVSPRRLVFHPPNTVQPLSSFEWQQQQHQQQEQLNNTNTNLHSELPILQQYLDLATHHEIHSNINAAISNMELYIVQSHNYHHHHYPQNSSQSLSSSSSSTTFSFHHSKAVALHKLAALQWKASQYDLSLDAIIESVNLYQCLLDDYGVNSASSAQLALESAHVFVTAGRVYLSKGEGNAAMGCYQECVRHLSLVSKNKDNASALPPHSTGATTNTDGVISTPARIFAQACVGAGRVLASQGKLNGALKRYKRSLKVQLGYSVQRENDTAASVANQDIPAISLDRACVPLPDVAETFSHLGHLYEQLGDLTRALECHTRAFDIYALALGSAHVDVGYASNNIGRLLQSLGRFAEAEEALTVAHQVLVQCLGEGHRNISGVLLNLGLVYASRGRHKRALDSYKQALRVQRAVFGGKSHIDMAATFQYIAFSHESSFKLDKAMKYYEKEIHMLKSTLHHHHLDVARTLHHMASVAMHAVDNMGEYLMLDQTMAWLEEALTIFHHHSNDGGTKTMFGEEISYLEETRKILKKRKI